MPATDREIGMDEALRELTRLSGENAALRDALQECVWTAAECRRWLTPEGYKDPLPYKTYRTVWDASRQAEVKALAILDGGLGDRTEGDADAGR